MKSVTKWSIVLILFSTFITLSGLGVSLHADDNGFASEKIDFEFLKECQTDGGKLNPRCSHEWALKNGNTIHFLNEKYANELLERFEGKKKDEKGNYSTDNYVVNEVKEGDKPVAKPAILSKLQNDGICLTDVKDGPNKFNETFEQCYARIKRYTLNVKVEARNATLTHNKTRLDMSFEGDMSGAYATGGASADIKGTVLNDFYRLSRKKTSKPAAAQKYKLVSVQELRFGDDSKPDPVFKKSKSVLIEDDKRKKIFGLENTDYLEIEDNEVESEITKNYMEKVDPEKRNSSNVKSVYLKDKYAKDRENLDKIKKQKSVQREDAIQIDASDESESVKAMKTVMDDVDQSAVQNHLKRDGQQRQPTSALDGTSDKKIYASPVVNREDIGDSGKNYKLDVQINSLIKNSSDPTETN